MDVMYAAIPTALFLAWAMLSMLGAERHRRLLRLRVEHEKPAGPAPQPKSDILVVS